MIISPRGLVVRVIMTNEEKFIIIKDYLKFVLIREKSVVKFLDHLKNL